MKKLFSVENRGTWGTPSPSASDPQSRQSAKLFFQSSKLGLPQPLTRRRVCPPPLVPGGVAHFSGERGGGRVPFRRGDKYCGTLYKFALCALSKQSWARICKPFKEPRNRFSACRVGTTTLFVVPARLATEAGRIDSSESIPGLYKRLQIRALILPPMTKGTGEGCDRLV